MDASILDLWQQAWRLAVTLVVPTLAIPVVSLLSSFVFGLIGVRDEAVAYALRVLVLVGVGMVCAPIVANSFVALMTQALR